MSKHFNTEQFNKDLETLKQISEKADDNMGCTECSNSYLDKLFDHVEDFVDKYKISSNTNTNQYKWLLSFVSVNSIDNHIGMMIKKSPCKDMLSEDEVKRFIKEIKEEFELRTVSFTSISRVDD